MISLKMSVLEPPKRKGRLTFAVVEECVYGLPSAPLAIPGTNPCTYGQLFKHYRA